MALEHTYKPFDTDIDRLRSSVTTMGAMVDRQLARAVDAVRLRDLGLVTQILAEEHKVNELHSQTDLRCNQTIAKRQPIAVDLREIIAVLKINNDLERIGDEAKKIAFKSRDFASTGVPIPLDGVEKMAALVSGMLRQALDAFIRHDAGVADALNQRDDEVDDLRDELIRQLMGRMSDDPDVVTAALSMIFVVQSIERVGDHAKSIAEHVVHVVEGVDIRHAPTG
jgi:phosphate transport system protein